MIKTQKETFRGYGIKKQLSAQTAVECRFSGVETVLAVHASVLSKNAEADNGEVRYTGKVHFFIVYENAEKKVCREEKGVEFSAKVSDDGCYPAMTARVALRAENVSVRREGASVYASALLGADITLYGDETFEYLSDGDLVVKREPVCIFTAHLCEGRAEADDEFDTDYIGDILMHTETVNVTDVTCETGILRAEGEVNLCVLALKGENALVSYERLVPFNLEIPCDAASFGLKGSAEVEVENVSLQAETDEEKGKCLVAAEITLRAEGCVYEETELEVVTDAFSCNSETRLVHGEIKSGALGEKTCFTERVSDKAALSAPVDFSDVFQAIALQRAEGNIVYSSDGKRAEGVVAATLFVLGTDGTHRGVEMSLPFSVPVQTEGESDVRVMVCGISARQKQEGEVYVEATLKFTVTRKRNAVSRQVIDVEEGAPVEEGDSAISVYIPRAGDGLWELAKYLKKAPDDVSRSNPDIAFPIREGQRVVIYRKKSV